MLRFNEAVIIKSRFHGINININSPETRFNLRRNLRPLLLESIARPKLVLVYRKERENKIVFNGIIRR